MKCRRVSQPSILSPVIADQSSRNRISHRAGDHAANTCSRSALWPACALRAGAFAQTNAQISGRVTDASGAVVPGVDVTLTNIDTGVDRSAVTNETGAYAFPSLNPGRTACRRRCRASAPSRRPISSCRSAPTSSSIRRSSRPARGNGRSARRRIPAPGGAARHGGVGGRRRRAHPRAAAGGA